MCFGNDLEIEMGAINFIEQGKFRGVGVFAPAAKITGAAKCGGKSFHAPGRQRGVVLLITLIVLVAMMLAGIGMMRSVDTTTMIAGNVAFREATLAAGEKGMNMAIANLSQIAANANDKQVLYYNDGDSPSYIPPNQTTAVNVCPGTLSTSVCRNGSQINFPGYRAMPWKSCEIYPPTTPANANQCISSSDYQWWTQPGYWAGTPTSPIPSYPVTDANGNLIATVYYQIHRMCRCADTAPDGTCPDGITQTCQTIQQSTACTGCSQQVGTTKFTATMIYYRVTTKAVGPRNTVAYSQALVLAPQ